MDPIDPLAQCAGFEWDESNFTKNWEKHRVAFWEAEETFLNHPFRVSPATAYSGPEERYYALGKTDSGRLLFLVFTIRAERVRIISARDMSRKERKAYEHHEEKTDPAV